MYNRETGGFQMVDIEMLKQLSLINGVSGYEKHVTRFMKSYLLENTALLFSVSI